MTTQCGQQSSYKLPHAAACLSQWQGITLELQCSALPALLPWQTLETHRRVCWSVVREGFLHAKTGASTSRLCCCGPLSVRGWYTRSIKVHSVTHYLMLRRAYTYAHHTPSPPAPPHSSPHSVHGRMTHMGQHALGARQYYRQPAPMAATLHPCDQLPWLSPHLRAASGSSYTGLRRQPRTTQPTPPQGPHFTREH